MLNLSDDLKTFHSDSYQSWNAHERQLYPCGQEQNNVHNEVKIEKQLHVYFFQMFDQVFYKIVYRIQINGNIFSET